MEVRHSLGETTCATAVVCAGGWADRLARGAGAPADPRIVPFRGSYCGCGPSAATWCAA